jgi:hypothetical protein
MAEKERDGEGEQEYIDLTPREYAEVPENLAGWRDMEIEQLEQAFKETPPNFQTGLFRFLCRTETCLQSYLTKLEKHQARSKRRETE